MEYQFWGATDVGQIRQINEDSYAILPESGLVAVADGMGGYERGDVAASLAIDVLRESLTDQRRFLDAYAANPSTEHLAAVRSVLENAFQRACEEVYRASRAIATTQGHMGTTLDAVLLLGRTAFIAHVGDGRVYLRRGGEIHPLTEDHSLVSQQLKENRITAEEARKARFKNVVTRALGVFPSVLVDLIHTDLDEGDLLLLCSDGLHRYLGARELGFLLDTPNFAEVPEKLIDLANTRGGRDNSTVVLIRAGTAPRREGTVSNAARADALRKVDVFTACTYRELVAIQALSTQIRVPSGQIVFKEDEIGRELYVLISGKVLIEKEGTELATLEAPSYFGEMSFIDQPRRSATARTLVDSTFLVLRREQFLQLMKKDSALAAKVTWRLLHRLSRLLRETNEKLVAESIQLDEPLFDLPTDAVELLAEDCAEIAAVLHTEDA
jgi:serine/threonine protein phosphatase PrpC/CRP-like cAMP-binding protein